MRELCTKIRQEVDSSVILGDQVLVYGEVRARWNKSISTDSWPYGRTRHVALIR